MGNRIVEPQTEVKPLKTIFVNDIDMYHDIDDTSEAEEMVDDLNRILKPLNMQIELVLNTHAMIDVKNHTGHVDLFVIDYGGMSLMGASGLATSNVRYACEWAEAHPSALLIIWTEFTRRIYEDELDGEFDAISNILMHYGSQPWDSDADRLRFITEFLAWLGIKIEDYPGELTDAMVLYNRPTRRPPTGGRSE